MGYSMYYNGEIAVSPILTETDAAIVRALVEGERSEETQAVFAAIAASPEPDLPWHTGLLIEIVDDLIFNAGPSWAPNHFASNELKQAVRELLDSADDAGCSTDLTVVGSEQLEAVRSRLPKY